jgi:hypothetical protein
MRTSAAIQWLHAAWRSFWGAVVLVVLIAPVPASATLTWTSPWTATAPKSWSFSDTPSGNSDVLNIMPAKGSNKGITDVVYTFQTTVTQSANSPIEQITPSTASAGNITANPSSGGTFNVAIKTPLGFTIDSIANNQFTSGTITGIPVANGNPNPFTQTWNVMVTFTFTPGTSWTTASSAFTITFTGT